MPRIVRGALVQASWTGDKESMIQKHEDYAHQAAKQGAQFILFQELFYGPYFCQVQDPQYFAYTEKIPGGPTTERMQALAKETGMVLIVPMYEEDADTTGIYYNTAAVIDADGSLLGVHPEHGLCGVDFATGSLGHGLSLAAGAALAARLERSSRRAVASASQAGPPAGAACTTR